MASKASKYYFKIVRKEVRGLRGVCSLAGPKSGNSIYTDAEQRETEFKFKDELTNF